MEDNKNSSFGNKIIVNCWKDSRRLLPKKWRVVIFPHENCFKKRLVIKKSCRNSKIICGARVNKKLKANINKCLKFLKMRRIRTQANIKEIAR